MKVLFKNKTKYSKEAYDEFLEFHQEKYGFSYYTYTFAIAVALLFCFVMQIQSKNYFISILTFVILVLFLLWRFYNPIQTVKQEKQSKKIENEQEFIFKFFEKKFLIYSQKLNRQVFYWQLHKVFETEEYFYLYIDKTHAFLLDKQSFEIGTPEGFSDFIREKCKFKFSSKI